MPVKQVTARIKFTGYGSYRVELDRLRFHATSGETTETPLADPSHRYLDPFGGTLDFWNIPPGTSYVLQVDNVQAGLVGVNWAFSPMPIEAVSKRTEQDRISIKIFRGTVLDQGALVPPGRYAGILDDTGGNDLVRQAHIHPRNGETHFGTGLFEVEPGTYSVVFTNNADNPLNDAPSVYSKPYSYNGSTNGSWIFLPTYRDYLIKSSFGGVTLESVARQVPGPSTSLPWTSDKSSFSTHEVFIRSWHGPVGLPGDAVDKDSDLIWDGIDGGLNDDDFVSEYAIASLRFTNLNIGGVTFGEVIEPAGLQVNVTDPLSPDLGILVSVTGIGGGQSTVNVCETTVLLTNGDVLLATCNSTGFDVHNGPVEIPLLGQFVTTIPTGGSVFIDKLSEREVSVKNIGLIQAMVITGRDESIELLAGDEVILEAGRGLPSPTPSPFGTPTPTPTALPTPTPFPTPTPVPSGTATPVPTATPTPVPSGTATPVPTATPTPTPGPTPVMDVSRGDLRASSPGLHGRRDERSGSLPGVWPAPGHGAQDAGLLGAPKIATPGPTPPAQA